MNKKKVLKIILLFILIAIIIFLAITIRKMIIISDLNNKVSKYINSNNHYEKIVNNSGGMTEFYLKDENALMIYTLKEKDTGKNRKLMQYTKGDKVNTYIEAGDSKIAMLGASKDEVQSQIMIMGFDYENNLWSLFKLAAMSKIKTVKYEGKDCYFVESLIADNAYIQKQTGLTLKANNGYSVKEDGTEEAIVAEYYYEFDNVDDSIFVEPDISQYKIQENN